jgi:hypothetical protein
MFYVLIATPLGSHGGSCPYQGQSMFPHIVMHHIHEYDDDFPWIRVPGLGARRHPGIIIRTPFVAVAAAAAAAFVATSPSSGNNCPNDEIMKQQ